MLLENRIKRTWSQSQDQVSKRINFNESYIPAGKRYVYRFSLFVLLYTVLHTCSFPCHCFKLLKAKVSLFAWNQAKRETLRSKQCDVAERIQFSLKDIFILEGLYLRLDLSCPKLVEYSNFPLSTLIGSICSTNYPWVAVLEWLAGSSGKAWQILVGFSLGLWLKFTLPYQTLPWVNHCVCDVQVSSWATPPGDWWYPDRETQSQDLQSSRQVAMVLKHALRLPFYIFTKNISDSSPSDSNTLLLAILLLIENPTSQRNNVQYFPCKIQDGRPSHFGTPALLACSRQWILTVVSYQIPFTVELIFTIQLHAPTCFLAAALKTLKP